VEARCAYGYCFEDRPAVSAEVNNDVYDAYEHKFFFNVNVDIVYVHVDMFNLDNEHNDYDKDNPCAGVADHG
jgi:hypothetical protein